MLKQRLKEPFGKAGLTVAILALVLALVGGAYAAGGLTKSQEKQVTKIAKKYAGKPGAAGATGTNGSPGAKGDAGAAGSNGTNGTSGTNGVSAEAIAFSGAKGTCTEGGLEVKSAKPAALICNGEKGTTGFTETLPQGSTETGVWTLQGQHQKFETEVEGQKQTITIGSQVDRSPISFPIPLAQAPTPHFIPEGTPAAGTGDLTENSSIVKNLSTTTGGAVFSRQAVISGTGIPAGTTIKQCMTFGEPIECEIAGVTTELELSNEVEAGNTATGVALNTAPPAGCAGKESEPEAEAGNLCVFAASEKNGESFFGFSFITTAGANTATKFGTFFVRKPVSSGPVEALGTWAVTAE